MCCSGKPAVVRGACCWPYFCLIIGVLHFNTPRLFPSALLITHLSLQHVSQPVVNNRKRSCKSFLPRSSTRCQTSYLHEMSTVIQTKTQIAEFMCNIPHCRECVRIYASKKICCACSCGIMCVWIFTACSNLYL